MVSKASDPVIPESQAVLFYLYTDDVTSAYEELAARGFEPGPISTPFYAPRKGCDACCHTTYLCSVGPSGFQT